MRSRPGDHRSATDALVEWLDARDSFAAIEAVVHRVVHGMDHVEPERVTPGLLDELRRLEPIDPDHLPLEIEMIEAVARRCPGLPQVACFDTAFHRTLPRVTQLCQFLVATTPRGSGGMAFTACSTNT